MNKDAKLLEENKIRAKHFKYLEKIRLGLISEEELADFVFLILNKNPYFNYKHKVILVIRSLKSKEGYRTYGKYYRNISQIAIDNQFLKDVAEGRENFVELLETLGHEFRHFMQDNMVERRLSKFEDKEQKDFYNKLFKNEGVTFSQKDIYNLVMVGSKYIDSKFFNSLDRKLEKNKIEYIDHICFGQYLNKINEEDARDSSLLFVKTLLKCYENDEMADKYLKEWLIKERKKIDILTQRNDNNKKQEQDYLLFLKEIKAINIETLKKVKRDFINLNKQTYSFQFLNNSNKEASFNLNKFIQHIKEFIDIGVKIIYEDKNLDDIIAQAVENINKNDLELFDEILKYVNKELDKEDKKKFNNTIFEAFLKEENIKKINTTSMWMYLSLRQCEQIYEKLKVSGNRKDCLAFLNTDSSYTKKNIFMIKETYPLLLKEFHETLNEFNVDNKQNYRRRLSKLKTSFMILRNNINTIIKLQNTDTISQKKLEKNTNKIISNIKIELKELEIISSMLESFYQEQYKNEKKQEVKVENEEKNDLIVIENLCDDLKEKE